MNEDAQKAVRALNEAIAALQASRDAIIAAEPDLGLAEQLTVLDQKLTEVVATGNNDKYRAGTEIHGKLRRAKAELDALEAKTGPNAELRTQLRDLTDRLLKEVFNYVDPGQQAV